MLLEIPFAKRTKLTLINVTRLIMSLKCDALLSLTWNFELIRFLELLLQVTFSALSFFGVKPQNYGVTVLRHPAVAVTNTGLC
jgi:hypothetical protein